MSEETQEPQPVPVLAQVTNIWALVPTKAMGGVSFMWRRGNLHSIATTAYNPGWSMPCYAVPMVQWAMLRMLSDRFHVPSSVYIQGEGETVLYATWPVHSGLMYETEEDSKLGGLVCVPHNEFKVVERPKPKET